MHGAAEGEEVGRAWWSPADTLTLVRIPLAVLFVAVPDPVSRLAILFIAAASDLGDGLVARRWGSSRLGTFLDPVADKLFAAGAFGVILVSGTLAPFEVLGVLVRDIVAAIAFLATLVLRRPAAIPARLGGKAVTIGQFLTVVAFLGDSPLLRPLAWATAAMALYAIWDYQRVAPRARRPLGE